MKSTETLTFRLTVVEDGCSKRRENATEKLAVVMMMLVAEPAGTKQQRLAATTTAATAEAADSERKGKENENSPAYFLYLVGARRSCYAPALYS